MHPILIILAAFLLTKIGHRLLYNVNINMADEGYLWYGVKKVRKGFLPIRDFRAYDPGRYWFYALFFSVHSCELVSLRIVNSLLTMIGLVLCGLILEIHQIPIGFTLFILPFMYLALGANHKSIDLVTPLVSIFLLSTFCLNTDSTNIAKFLWVWVGLTWLIGLNHFLYNTVGIGLFFLVLWISGSLSWAEIFLPFRFIGLGILPMLMFLTVPGNGKVYYHRKISPILQRKSTNLKIDLPHFWHLDQNASRSTHILSYAKSVTPLFLISTLVYLLIEGRIASPSFGIACLSIPYFNHFLSRSDREHFRPVSIILSLLLLHLKSIPALICSALLIYVIYELYGRVMINSYKNLKKSSNPHVFNIQGCNFFLRADDKQLFELIRQLLENLQNRSNPSILAVPLLASVYPIFDLEPPIYDIFPVYPANKARQESIMNELQKQEIDFCVVQLLPLDGREDLLFKNTHPLVWSYLQTQLERFESGLQRQDISIFTRQKSFNNTLLHDIH